jgi:2-polyprenyl-6-methoxyphenol hydroxylase-like FAD-dependent oxidoreductase
MVEEAALPSDVPTLSPHEPSREHYSGPYRLVTYLVPGADGSSEPGRRRLNLVWYDPARSDLLAERGLLEGTTVHGSLLPEDVSEPLRDELRAMASRRWPSPWREAMEIALEQGLVFGTPIVQFWPPRLVRGRVALAGDAAHAASPMVGGGFRQGLFDVGALADASEHQRDVGALLEGYETRRLAPARAHVERSQMRPAIWSHSAANAPRTLN